MSRGRYGADVILRATAHLHCCPYHGVCLLGRDLPYRLGSVVSRLSLSPCLVPDVGFEPTALALQKPCSTTELIRQLVLGGACQSKKSHTHFARRTCIPRLRQTPLPGCGTQSCDKTSDKVATYWRFCIHTPHGLSRLISRGKQSRVSNHSPHLRVTWPLRSFLGHRITGCGGGTRTRDLQDMNLSR